jgi:uncharacterized protein (TIGR04141 family)
LSVQLIATAPWGAIVSKSRSFSIYLLKDGFDATNSLKEDHSLEDGVEAANLPEDATLYILDNHPRDPWWKEYFAVQKPLGQVSKGALVFLPSGGRCFALSFGHVAHNLEDSAYEYDFGLRVTLNSLDPAKLKSTDIIEPSAARRRRTQVPVDSDLTYFDFDRDSAILKSLTGRVKEEHAELFKHATGASNLRISTNVQSDGLSELCDKLLALYKSEEFRTAFPNIQNITPVRDPVVIQSLNELLVSAVRSQNENIYLTVPDIVDFDSNLFASFSGEGPSLVYDDPYMARYYEYLEGHGVAPNDLDLQDLRDHALRLTDEDGTPYHRYPILKCLLFDTTLGQGTETFHLAEGNWYKIESSYITKLNNLLNPLCETLTLPAYDHADETAYNAAVGAGDILCLDKSNISPPGESMVEPCDLYFVKEDRAVFLHIKISTVSARLSHLFNQGVNAIELLKLDPGAVTRLKLLIADKISPGTEPAPFTDALDKGQFQVTSGIITHKNPSLRAANLPIFSRISLMRTMRSLQVMSVPAVFGFIADNASKTAGKKKARKPKAKVPEVTLTEIEE